MVARKGLRVESYIPPHPFEGVCMQRRKGIRGERVTEDIEKEEFYFCSKILNTAWFMGLRAQV